MRGSGLSRCRTYQIVRVGEVPVSGKIFASNPFQQGIGVWLSLYQPYWYRRNLRTSEVRLKDRHARKLGTIQDRRYRGLAVHDLALGIGSDDGSAERALRIGDEQEPIRFGRGRRG